MKFKFNTTEKNILRTVFNDSIEGIMCSNLSKEIKKENLKKVKKAINQVSYNSFVSNFNNHLIKQLPEVLETKIKLLKSELKDFQDKENSEEDIKNIETVIEKVEGLKTRFENVVN
jgi:predicted transcriptional regulator